MNTITVIDSCDDTRNTAFVNGLSEPRHRRAVVHAPASSEGLFDEILRALDCELDANTRTVAAWQRAAWVTAWICAFDRLELIVYGAWRLKTRDLRWLHALARRPTVRLWLVSHDQAHNLTELLAIADVVWSWEQFHGYWHTRVRNQRRPPRRPMADAEHDCRAIAIGALAPRDPWPWAIPRMLLADGRCAELMGAASRVTYGAHYAGANALRVAVHLHDLFSDWRTPAQRSFVLMALKNALFCQHIWLDWDRALTDVYVPRRVHQKRPVRCAVDPALAASQAVARSAHQLGDDGEYQIGADGSHVVLETGETIPIAGPDRPALRAYQTLRGSPHGMRLKRPMSTVETTSTPATVVRPAPALSQIASAIEVRPLVVRVSDDAEPLTIEPTRKLWNSLSPAPLDYRHTAVLSQLLRCVQREEYPREPLRGSTTDDVHVLLDLYRHGLVIDGAHGRPELGHWPHLLWRYGQVTMPPP